MTAALTLSVPSPRSRRTIEILLSHSPTGWDCTELLSTEKRQSDAEGKQLIEWLETLGIQIPTAARNVLFRLWVDMDLASEPTGHPDPTSLNQAQTVLATLGTWLGQLTETTPNHPYFQTSPLT